jgi:hypothetical protein
MRASDEATRPLKGVAKGSTMALTATFLSARAGVFSAVTLVSLALLFGCKPAVQAPSASQAGAAAMFPASTTVGAQPTLFTDPNEHAFTVLAPAGWTVKGGLTRSSTTSALPWVQELSADGASSVFYGDPSLPNFLAPNEQRQEGSVVSTQFGDEPVQPYENGQQFAADYAQKVFGAACSNIQQSGAQPEPDVAQKAQDLATTMQQATGSTVPPESFDGGSVTFSCQAKGVAYVVGVTAVTALSQASGFWNVATLYGYRAPATQAADADKTARAVDASYQTDPQWQQKTIATNRQAIAQIQSQGAQDMAALNQQAAINRQISYERGEQEGAQLNAQHAAFMNSFNAQGAARNAAFANQQQQKQSGQDSEMRYINNTHCVQWYDEAHTSCRITAPN